MNPDQPNPEFRRPPELEDRILEMHTAAMREMAEPRDGIRPTPVAYLIMCFLFTMWGGFYMGTYGGDWTGNGLAERSTPAAEGPKVTANPMVLGAEIYNACTQCHQADGKGLPGQFPPLADSEFVNGDPKRLAAIVLNGLNGEIEVSGKKYNSQMPAWKDNYNDEEVAAVMTFVRGSFGNKSALVGKDVVEAVRKDVGGGGVWNAQSLSEYASKH